MSSAVTVLNASLEIRDVEEIRGRLLDALNGASDMRVDVSAVTVADTAGVQLLLSLKAEAEHRGIRCELVGKSTALDRALLVLGLSSAIVGASGHGK
jgi:anti-anti-sigma regulatory factor